MKNEVEIGFTDTLVADFYFFCILSTHYQRQKSPIDTLATPQNIEILVFSADMGKGTSFTGL